MSPVTFRADERKVIRYLRKHNNIFLFSLLSHKKNDTISFAIPKQCVTETLFSPLNLLFKRLEHECSFYSETEIRRATSAIRVTHTFEVRWKTCCDGSYILLEVKIGPLLHFLLRSHLAIGLPSMDIRLNYSVLRFLRQTDKYFNFIQWSLCSIWE